MSLEIFLGPNKSGKTYSLTKELKNAKGELVDKENILYIPAEIQIDDFVSSEKINNRKKDSLIKPHYKIVNFINNLYKQSFCYSFTDEDKEKIKQSINLVEKSLKSIKEDKDQYFESEFKNWIKLNKRDYDKYTIIVDDFIKINIESLNDNNFSSGTGIYSLLKLIYNIVKGNKCFFNFEIYIDEIEKFLHPDLIYKVANVIYELSKNIKIKVSTHSPLFLERIFWLKKNERTIKSLEAFVKTNNINFENIQLLYQKINNLSKEEFFQYIQSQESQLDKKSKELIANYFFSFAIHHFINKEKNSITNFSFLSNLNNREIISISKAFFSEKIILCEGINDYNFFSNMVFKYDFYVSIIECGSRSQVKKIRDILIKNLNLHNRLKIIISYDLDNLQEIPLLNNNETQIKFNPNLELHFFDTIPFNDKQGIKREKDNIDFSFEFIEENGKQNSKDLYLNIEDIINNIFNINSRKEEKDE